MKHIFALVGEIAAGKTTVATYLEQTHDATPFRFSTMLRDVLDRLHIEQTREHLQALSTSLRTTFSDDLLSKVIAQDVHASDAQYIVIDGVRRPSDITYLQKLDGFSLVSIQTDPKIRFERLTARTENLDDAKKTWEEFQQQAKQESEAKIQEIATQANIVINNNGTKEELYKQIDSLLNAS